MEIEMSMSEFLKKIEPRRNYILYVIEVDGKFYVGRTKNFKHRIETHISRCYNRDCPNYNMRVYKHIRSNNIDFTEDTFTVEVLLLNYTREESLWAERKLLEEFKNEGKNMLNEILPIVSEEEEKEREKKRAKKYYEENKEEINRKEKERIANETPAQREERLRKARERDRKRKASETPAQKEKRLRKQRERERKKRLLPQKAENK